MYTKVLCPGLNCILWFFLLSWYLSVIWVLIRYESYDFRCFLPVIVFFDIQKFLIFKNLSLFFGEGNGTPLQYSCLENPMDGEAWWAAVHEVAKSRTWLSDFTFSFHFHALEKEMAAHCSVLAWRIPGTGECGGLPSMGWHRVGHDWSDLAVCFYCCLCLWDPPAPFSHFSELYSFSTSCLPVRYQSAFILFHVTISELPCWKSCAIKGVWA